MNRRHALLVLAAAVPLGGCLQQRAGRPYPTRTGSVARAAAPVPDVRGGGEGYTLSTGDKLRVIVFGQDSLSNIYQVDGSGRIAMPLVGAVAVAGLSTGAAAEAIERRLRDGYLREPKVTVEVDTYRPFFILGEVTTSGQFPYVNGMTVQTAVAIAGGFSPRGNRDTAEVSRRTPRGVVVAEVPMTFVVRPGDTITIKERWF